MTEEKIGIRINKPEDEEFIWQIWVEFCRTTE